MGKPDNKEDRFDGIRNLSHFQANVEGREPVSMAPSKSPSGRQKSNARQLGLEENEIQTSDGVDPDAAFVRQRAASGVKTRNSKKLKTTANDQKKVSGDSAATAKSEQLDVSLRSDEEKQRPVNRNDQVREDQVEEEEQEEDNEEEEKEEVTIPELTSQDNQETE